MLVVTDHNKLLKDAMNKIGPITNMSKFIVEWVEKSFGMTATMPDEPDIGSSQGEYIRMGWGDHPKTSVSWF